MTEPARQLVSTSTSEITEESTTQPFRHGDSTSRVLGFIVSKKSPSVYTDSGSTSIELQWHCLPSTTFFLSENNFRSSCVLHCQHMLFRRALNSKAGPLMRFNVMWWSLPRLPLLRGLASYQSTRICQHRRSRWENRPEGKTLAAAVSWSSRYKFEPPQYCSSIARDSPAAKPIAESMIVVQPNRFVLPPAYLSVRMRTADTPTKVHEGIGRL